MLVHSRGLHLGVFVGSWELVVHLCIPCLEGGGGLGPVSEGADCELLVQLWDLCLGGRGEGPGCGACVWVECSSWEGVVGWELLVGSWGVHLVWLVPASVGSLGPACRLLQPGCGGFSVMFGVCIFALGCVLSF